MADHDALCRNLGWRPWTEGARCPECDFIARARADERTATLRETGGNAILALEAKVAALTAERDQLRAEVADLSARWHMERGIQA